MLKDNKLSFWKKFILLAGCEGNRAHASATPAQKPIRKKLAPQQIQAAELPGEKITGILTTAAGTDSAIGELKVMTENGWFAARPSRTEDVYKIFAESFQGETHLKQIQEEASAIISKTLELWKTDKTGFSPNGVLA